MFRLIKIVFNAFLLVLAFIGFNAIGGEKYIEPIKVAINDHIQEYRDNITKKMGDFSDLNEEFQIDKAVNFMGYNAMLAAHKASGQKMVILDSGRKPLLTPEDIQSDEIEKKLKTLSEKFRYHGASVKDIKVTERGKLKIYGQNVPYAKFVATVTKLPVSDIGGIVASVRTSDGSEKLALSLSENKRYSQLITNEFFKGVNEGTNKVTDAR